MGQRFGNSPGRFLVSSGARIGWTDAMSGSEMFRFTPSQRRSKPCLTVVPGKAPGALSDTQCNQGAFKLPRVALFHDFLVQMGGAERVTEALHRILPDADIHTTMTAPEKLSPQLREAQPKTSWMQMLPFKSKLFRHYFLLYPFAIESADLSAYDLVISSCFGFAKGVRKGRNALHVCYCHNPMRWVWNTTKYLEREGMPAWKKSLVRLALKPLRAWELHAAKRPDYYIANSRVVAQRLREAFGREATVIPPPVDTSRFNTCPYVDDYFLVLSRLAPYKRIDLAVQACTRLNRRLVIIGDGVDRKRLQSMAGPSVSFLGRVPDEVVAHYAKQCRALLFTGEEDFGIAALEVNAAGRPVVAYHGGGATETIIEGVNGLFFREQTVDSLADALVRFDQMEWDTEEIRRQAERYDTVVFSERVLDFLNHVMAKGEVALAEETRAA
jgi:glycosyltransferase involved in cell wall biosynthesis